jgi:hypothetical protein
VGGTSLGGGLRGGSSKGFEGVRCERPGHQDGSRQKEEAKCFQGWEIEGARIEGGCVGGGGGRHGGQGVAGRWIFLKQGPDEKWKGWVRRWRVGVMFAKGKGGGGRGAGEGGREWLASSAMYDT